MDRAAKAALTSPAYKRSKKQEKGLAKRYGGLQTAASGARHKKGDVYVNQVVRIEAKTTQKQSFSVTKEMLDKLTLACVACDELPVIVIEFLDGTGKPEGELAVMPTWALEGLIGRAKTST